MKKIINIFPILILIIVTFLTISLEDMKEKQLYKDFKGYDVTAFVIPENTDVIKNEDIDKIFNSAKKNHVILVKTSYNKQNNSIDKYVTTNDIYTLYGKQLDINKNGVNNKIGITTYKQQNTVYYEDFLNNDRYSFYSVDLMKEKGVYRYGAYLMYYQNEIDYLNFLKSAEEILKVSKDMMQSEFFGQFDEPIEIFNTTIIFCFGFFSLFYFVLVLFLFYRNAKLFGILSLLGFSNGSILKNILKRYILTIILGILLLFALCLISLPNMKFYMLIRLTSVYIIIFVASIIISYLALRLLQKFFCLSNVIKKQSIVQKISDLCLICKFVLVSCMMLITVNYLPLVKELIRDSNNLNNNKILMDYAVFPRIRLENSEYDDYDKYLTFYNELEKQNIDYIYVNFGEYLQKDKNIIESYNLSELNGTKFRLASVNLKYLNLYNMEYFSKDGKLINITENKKEFYLLPISKKDYTDKLHNNIKDKYKRYGIDQDVFIYYYKNRLFDTFDSQEGVHVVDSPIFRVVSIHNPFTYFENSYGIDVAGTGMSTALKFNISKTEQFYRDELYRYIKKSGLENVLTEENFVRYKDFYNELTTRINHTNTIFISAISLCFLIYLFMLFQTFVLFIDARKNEILVKSLLGFNKKDIFSNVILWNVGATLLPICFICTYLMTKGEDALSIIAVCGIFLIIDLIVILIIANIIKINRVYAGLKGE